MTPNENPIRTQDLVEIERRAQRMRAEAVAAGARRLMAWLRGLRPDAKGTGAGTPA